MYMRDWVKKLDGFLNLNDRDVLNHAGRISHNMAKELAESEYEKFNTKRIAENDQRPTDFDNAVKLVEEKRGLSQKADGVQRK